MNAKPIFIIGIPDTLPNEAITDISVYIGQKLTDYHFLAFPTKSNEFTFNVFNSDKIEDCGIEEIKQYIKENIKTK